jgi:chromosome segregation ATPase
LETLTAKLEKQIAEAEENIAKIDTELENPAVAGDFSKVSELAKQREELTQKLDELTEQYFIASEELESMS